MATLKQKKLAHQLSEIIGKKGKIGDKTLTKILEDAGYSKETARTQQKVIINGQGTQEVLRAAGVTRERLSEKFSKLLDAQRIQHCTLYVQKEEGGSFKIQKSDDFIEVDDNKTQLDAAKFCAGMVGMAEPEDPEDRANKIPKQINIIMPDGVVINATGGR